MRLRRILMIFVAVLVIAFGALSFGMLAGSERTVGACQRCGDGYCARSCENATTCPRDCGGGGGGTTKAQ